MGPSFRTVRSAAPFCDRRHVELGNDLRNARGARRNRTGTRYAPQASMPQPVALIEIERGERNSIGIQVFPDI